MQYQLSNDSLICSCKDFKQAKKLSLIWKQLPIRIIIIDESIPDFSELFGNRKKYPIIFLVNETN